LRLRRRKERAMSTGITKRIIACLDVTQGRVVKGVQFVDLIDAGDPAELAHLHATSGADEIVLLDITATSDARPILIDVVRRTARQLFVPFTVGGGVRSLDDAAALFDAGADKISINSAAIKTPAVITEIAERFGSQAVIVAIDAKRKTGDAKRKVGAAVSAEGPASAKGNVAAEVYLAGGRIATGRDAVEWAREAESRGAGEILLTSMDCDGTRAGFDCPLTAAVATAVNIPVIASGGAGSGDHFVEVFKAGCADAALAASIFHFGIHDVRELKAQLRREGIPVRLPC
jgi:imidazole glycerol-phosphate synthase subunit HisF